jgi:hypothetical protein
MLTNLRRGFFAAGLAGALAVPAAALAGPAQAAQNSPSPSFVMTDSFGSTWTLRPTGASNGTQQYAGTVPGAPTSCGTYAVTATKRNDPTTGTWNWTFTESNTPESNPSCAPFDVVATGIGNLSGMWTNPTFGISGPWSATVTKGAGSVS